MHQPTYRITHTTAFVIPVVEHWLEREIACERRRCIGLSKNPALGMSRYRDANPVTTNPLTDDLATAPSEPVFLLLPRGLGW